MSTAAEVDRQPDRGAAHTRMFPRIAGTIVVGFLVVAVLLHLVRAHERLLDGLEASARSVVDRALVVDALLRRPDLSVDRGLLDALSTPWLRVGLAQAPPLDEVDPWPHAQTVRADIEAYLATRTDARFVIATRHGAREDHRRRHRGEAIIVALSQPDGRWLTVESDLQVLNASRTRMLLSWTTLGIVLVVVATLWLTRRLHRPLAHLAAAADRLGEDMHAPPLELRGPAEVRRAARAFNRMQQRLQQQLEQRTAMLAAISHDVRTVLTRLQLRIDSVSPDELRTRLHGDVSQATAMLDTSLAFARGDHEVETLREVDLAALCQVLVDDTQDRGASASYDGPRELIIHTRPLALQRALTNLVDNAVRYGKSADVLLSQDPDTVRIAVSDRGPGIDEADRNRVFEPFVRLEQSRNRDTGGSGLGLSVVRAVVESLGGSVTLANRDGGGLVVTLSVPRQPRGNGPD